MDQEKIKKRVVRSIAGITLAIVFIIFAIISCKVAVHSDECLTERNGRGIDSWYGYTRLEFLERQPKRERKNNTLTTNDSQLLNAYGDAALSVINVQVEETSENQASTEATVEETAVEVQQTELSPSALKAQEKGLPAPPEIDINDWQYMLVNPTHLLDATYAPEQLAYLNMTLDDTDIQTEYNANRCPVDSRIAEALISFTKACKDAGVQVYLSSGYRSYDDQMYLFNRKVGQGYSEEVAKTIVAYPGSSEHQTGLCCDITDVYRETKNSELENTETFKWLNDHCAEYGFILRYPKDKSGGADTITGVIYEPWHFRYVGVDVAKYITENNLCLEEFCELYA